MMAAHGNHLMHLGKKAGLHHGIRAALSVVKADWKAFKEFFIFLVGKAMKEYVGCAVPLCRI